MFEDTQESCPDDESEKELREIGLPTDYYEKRKKR